MGAVSRQADRQHTEVVAAAAAGDEYAFRRIIAATRGRAGPSPTEASPLPRGRPLDDRCEQSYSPRNLDTSPGQMM